MSRGISTNKRVTNQAACLQSRNITFVCRYYSTTTTQSEKRLTAPEASAIVGAGMSIVTVYEDGPTSPGYFSHSRGVQDAVHAHGAAVAIGQPAGSAIYFAVDYDATTTTTEGAITEYFQGVKDGLAQAGGGYDIGVYGSGRVCARIKENRELAKYSWLAESHGWAGHDQYLNPDIRQEIAHGTLCTLTGGVGGDYEDNFATANFGAFGSAGGGVGPAGVGSLAAAPVAAAGAGAAIPAGGAGAAGGYPAQVAARANGQFDQFHVFSEDDPPLRNQIRHYWEDIGFDFPGSSTPWSAVLVSWVMRQSGASASEFKASSAHSRFIFWAIQNLRNQTGLFWAHRLDEYAPKMGDIIQNNRGGQALTYDFAAAHEAYESHSAVVVEVGSDNNGRFAITVGGNESDTVGRKRVALNDNGFVRQRESNPYICVIENRKV
jgi:hypothetical protein